MDPQQSQLQSDDDEQTTKNNVSNESGLVLPSSTDLSIITGGVHKITIHDDDVIMDDDEYDSFSDLDDNELDRYLCYDEFEKEQRKEIWEAKMKEYVEERQQKSELARILDVLKPRYGH